MNAEQLKNKVSEFFSDRSRSQEETLDGLRDLKEDIDMYIEALESDLEQGVGMSAKLYKKTNTYRTELGNLRVTRTIRQTLDEVTSKPMNEQVVRVHLCAGPWFTQEMGKQFEAWYRSGFTGAKPEFLP